MRATLDSETCLKFVSRPGLSSHLEDGGDLSCDLPCDLPCDLRGDLSGFDDLGAKSHTDETVALLKDRGFDPVLQTRLYDPVRASPPNLDSAGAMKGFRDQGVAW